MEAIIKATGEKVQIAGPVLFGNKNTKRGWILVDGRFVEYSEVDVKWVDHSVHDTPEEAKARRELIALLKK